MSEHPTTPPTLPEPDELRDCPFCGQEAPSKDDDEQGCWVFCVACAARGPRANDRATSRALWNASAEAVSWFWKQP